MASKMNPGFMAMIAKKKDGAKGGAKGSMPPAPMGGMGGGMGMKKGGVTAMGKVKTAAPSRDGVAIKGKTKGTQIAMKKGGMAC